MFLKRIFDIFFHRLYGIEFITKPDRMVITLGARLTVAVITTRPPLKGASNQGLNIASPAAAEHLVALLRHALTRPLSF